MAISTNGTVLARLAGALYNTQMSNATYKEVAALDPSALANTLYARDFSSSTDLAVATTLVTNLGLSSITGLNNWVAAQLTAAGSAKGAKVVDLLNSFAQMTADTTYGAYATAFNTKVDAALALSQTTDNKGGTFAAAGVAPAAVGAVFALTAGTDVWTGGAGDDTVNATVASLGALDVVDGGAGNDTLNIVDTAAVASLGGATFSNFETVKISSGGAVGGLYTAATAAGTNTAAVAQVVTVTNGTPSATTQKYDVTIGGVVYTTAAVGTADKAHADTVIKDVLTAHLGDAISITNSTAGTIVVTSLVAGQALPSITTAISTATPTATGTTSVAATTANTIATGPIAVKQIETVTINTSAGSGTGATDTLAAGDLITVSVAGVDYVVGSSGTTATTAASDIASVINSVLGTGVASSAGGVVTISAPVAGTPLPAMNVKFTAADNVGDSWVQVSANQAANSAAVAATSAVAVGAPTGTTSYTVSATGVANVSGAATTALDVTGTSVQTSGGSSVKVAGSASVGVSGAAGAVTVVTSNPTTGTVLSNPSTGQTATYGSGIYVTGGTTVAVTQGGATVTSGVAGSARTNTIAVGVDPTSVLNVGSGNWVGAVKSPTSSSYFNAVGGLAGDPTGNVSVVASSAYTSANAGAVGKKAVAYAAATQKAFVNGADTVSLTGVGTGTITDVNTTLVQTSATDATGSAAGTSKLATVNLTGISGTTTIKSDAISNIKVVDATGSAAVTVANSGTTGVNAGALNLTVGNSTVTVTNTTATSVNVGSAVSAYETIDGTAPVLNTNSLKLVTAAATSLNFTNANTITLNGSGANVAKVATVTATNTGTLALGDLSSGWTKLTAVNAGGATGGVTATVGATPADAGLTITTGSGNDTITLSGNIGSTNGTYGGLVATSLSLGGGNDSVIYASGGSVTAGASIDAGDGVDTVSAKLVSGTNAAIFKNFERLALKDATNGGSLDAALLTQSTINGVKLNGNLSATGATYAVSNLAGSTVNVDISASTDVTLTATLASSAGTTDSAVVNFAYSATGTSNQTVTVAGLTSVGLESLVVNSGGSVINTADFTTKSVSNVLAAYAETYNALKTITVTGANEVSLGTVSISRDSTTKAVTAATFTTDFVSQDASLASTPATDVQSALTTIDASATTGGVNIYAGTSDAIAVGGSASGKYQVFDGLTITGGSGSDAIQNDAKGGVVNGGDGADWIVLNGGATAAGVLSSANGGNGADTLVVATTVSTILTGGAGADTFNVAAANGNTSGYTSSTAVTTITDLTATDKIVFKPAASSPVVVFTTAKVDVGAATTLAGALDIAASGTFSGSNTNYVKWFQYAGNTYVVEDNTSGTTTFASGDIVVKLAGLVDLSSSTIDSTTAVLTIV